MSTSVLPITNVINVTVSNTPSGLQERNVNSVAYFTEAQPDNDEDYGIYLSASQVAENYGTESVPADVANAIFAQTPNILTGRGQLVIIQLIDAVSAKAGYFTTADLTTKIAGIESISNGDLRVTVDGTNNDLTGLDFDGVTTLAEIAAILQAELTDCYVTYNSTRIIFTSKSVGVDADVVVTAVAGGMGTDLSGSDYFNTSAGVATSGVDSVPETIEAAITRTEGMVSYTGVITDLEMEDGVIESLADYIQARDLIFLHHFTNNADIAGIGTTIKDASDVRTRPLLYLETRAEANLMKAAYAGRAFSVNFSGSQTLHTMNLKSLATINSDSNMTQTIYTNAAAAGMDLYVNYSGVPSVVSNSNGLYFDQIYARTALKYALETAGFNYLRQTNTKVPQTEAGMDGLKAAYAKVMERFVNNGYIGKGLVWNSSETFGDPETFKNNITERGYYIYSLPIAQQSQADRENREAPLVQIAVKEAGAIHSSDVLVVVEA